ERALHTGTLTDPVGRSKGRSLSPMSICTKKGVSYKGLERRLLPYFRIKELKTFPIPAAAPAEAIVAALVSIHFAPSNLT
ncbi:hypothetical protein HAX54_032439, partial [Datura stramonium]|nr:hypothetical protein [Datura stramonium]